MPAAAVIPAPRAYMQVAAVEKLVVGFRVLVCNQALWGLLSSVFGSTALRATSNSSSVYFEELRVFQAGFGL